MRLLVGLVLVSASALSCATYEEDLARSQRAFDASEHERALAILRSLEPDMGRLGTSDQAHYAYLRGMTDYRIGYKVDARHWLAVGAAIEQQTPGSIPPESVTRLNEALKEMNEAVYSSGIESLSNDVSSAKTKRSDDEEGARDTDAPPAKDKKAPAKKPGAASPDSTDE
jgi:hypothetical protein